MNTAPRPGEQRTVLAPVGPGIRWVSDRTATDELLAGLLAVAVPIEVARLRGASDADRLSLAAACAQHIAEHGDDLQFRSSRKGATAAAFARLAIGLACAAYQPGGVTFAGLHWCINHDQCISAQRAGEAPAREPVP